MVRAPASPAPPIPALDDVAAARSAGSAVRLVTRLVIGAVLLTAGLIVSPFGKPDASELVTTRATGGPAPSAAAPTTSSPAGSTSARPGVAEADDRAAGLAPSPASVPSAYATTGPAAAGFDLDLIALAPSIRAAEEEAAVETGGWTEPAVEPESEWVDGGNGVRLPDLLLRIRFCESTNDYRAANSSSTARGAYQFLTKSWAWYGHADRYGVAQAHLATPAQQDEAALITYRESGARPWAESRPCWDDDGIDPRYVTVAPPAPAPTTTNPPPATSSTSTTTTSESTTSESTTTESTTTTSEPPSTETSTTSTTTTS